MDVKVYRNWVIEHALPFWGTNGFDHARGRFHERLDMVGRPLDVPHRVMVQARQIYVFSQAARFGWYLPGRALAERTMATTLQTYAHRSEGKCSFAFSADADGKIVSPIRDAYAHGFMLFALAALFQVNGEPHLLTIADETIAFLESDMTDRNHGGLFDTHPVLGRDKRQNPLMHLLEAYLLLERAAPGRGYLGRAKAIVTFFEEKLFRADPGILPEFFAPDFGIHADRSVGAVFEPGHHFEWVWLLHEFGRLSGQAVSPNAAMLFDIAARYGMACSGLIWDELGADFTITKPAHRLWPHTEAIKAAVARHLAGNESASGFGDKMAARLLKTFLDRPFAGGWTDQVSAEGKPLTDFVPASSLYHLFFAAVETERLHTGPSNLAETAL